MCSGFMTIASDDKSIITPVPGEKGSLREVHFPESVFSVFNEAILIIARVSASNKNDSPIEGLTNFLAIRFALFCASCHTQGFLL